ncbi:MAG: hypothetical protein B7Y11_07010 [Sphingobacteriia bacterium 24-36-13]|jgi:hypothetical protein|uniref:GIN domain-containing protein n=1 Tax=Sediminibacterium sp. TaxID=1917865 RepID=UPI000BDD9C4A|nr:DUF2807 domain-containing protein [Sediminibacterium sp.]OYY11390.1 MAG: hypothetical protein B7Y66_02890 [Sphingobacteriia bacterium 35-36-14]OYZ54031.1 MAG: hypothetical protein B7Y11_07010 [Sphingobacteriia bacterium 24-36-13]OZA63105.1 MAG: hypothetical protein B7X68_11760 [Sphingobacteriia bacterium 39-36-14]HQS24170.1 hypothetical protein [Sediminibacterium sp.]HQS35590.1 hypothetical protein [Sediminibacterium sp.]
MKKSNILLIITLSIVCICFIAVNIKLSTEYNKGAIQSVTQKKILPIFHHIKELNGLKNIDYTYKPIISIYERKDTSAIAYNFYNPIGYQYFVKNDTLYLKADSTFDGSIPSIEIYCKNLRSVITSNSQATLYNYKTDSIYLESNEHSSINAIQINSKSLKLRAQDNSTLSVSGVDTIHKGEIRAKHNGLIIMNNIYFKEQLLSIDSTASLTVSGKTLKGLNRMQF